MTILCEIAELSGKPRYLPNPNIITNCFEHDKTKSSIYLLKIKLIHKDSVDYPTDEIKQSIMHLQCKARSNELSRVG